MSETQYARIITKASTGTATIPPSADHSNGDWISTDIYEHELYIDDATGKLYTNISGVITDLNPVSPDTNFANTDLTLTGNRVHDLDGNLLKFDNGQFQVDGSMGINIVPDSITPAWLTIESTTTKRPLFVNNTGSSNTATFQTSGGGYAVVGSGNGTSAIYGAQSSIGAGVWGNSANGNAVLGTSSGATAVWGDGGIVAESWNIGSSRNTSAVLQANSTTQGFLPPRMTTAQKNAISSPTTGLMVYDLDRNRYEVYNGSYWAGQRRILYINHPTYNPLDSQTVFFSNINIVPVTTTTAHEIVLRGNGVIRACDFNTWASTAVGSAEDFSLYIRINSTDYLVQTISAAAQKRSFVNTSLNIPFVDGDVLRMSYITPAWVTNPTGLIGAGNLIIE